jgi:hypothetical protein
MQRKNKEALEAFTPLALSLVLLFAFVLLLHCTLIGVAAATEDCPHQGLPPACHISQVPHCSCESPSKCIWICEIKR